MPPTESRSRDEWLAEVRRRGERIRRRRRLTAALVGALALVLPVTALTTFLGGDRPGSVELTAAGPAPTGQVPATADGPTPEPGMAPSTETASSALATAGGLAAAGDRESPTTTVEVHGRVATINGSQTPRQTPTSTPTSTPTTAPSLASVPADDPVVRPPAGTTAAAGRAGAPLTADTTVPPADGPVTACEVTELRVTVVTERPSYAPGDTVRGSAMLENRSGRTCLVPSWNFLEVLDGAGENVFGASAVTGFQGEPGGSGLRTAKEAEAGATFTSTFYWAAAHCNDVPPIVVNETCAGRFPPGTYTVVARWDAGVSGRTTFKLSA